MEDQDPGTEELSLDSILQVTDVQVVQSVDAGSLKWILKKLQQADEGQAERIAALEHANEALKEQLEQLKEQQNGLALQALGGGGLEDGKDDSVQALKGLPKRVEALEMALKLGAQPQGDAGSDGGEKPTDVEARSRQGSGGASADGNAAAEQQQEGDAGEAAGGEGRKGDSSSASAEGNGHQKQMALPELQRRLEDLETKLKEAEKVLPAAKKAAEQAAAKAVEAAAQARPGAFNAQPPAMGSASDAGGGFAAAPGGVAGEAGVDGASGMAGNACAMGSAGLEGQVGAGGRTGGTGAAGGPGEAGKDGAPGSVRVLHLNDNGSVDPTQLIKVVNEGAADIAQLRMLMDVLQRKQDQLALAGLADRAGGLQSGQPGSKAGGGAAPAEVDAQPSVHQQQAVMDADGPGAAPVDAGQSDRARGKGRGFPWDATKAAAALQDVHSVKDALPFIKDLYDMVSSKVDRLPFEDLLRHVDRLRQMAASTNAEHLPHESLPSTDQGKTSSSGIPGDGLEKHAGTGDASPARPAAAHEAAAGDDDPLTISARLKMLMNKVGDLAFTVMQLQNSARTGAQGVNEAGGGGDEATAKQEADLLQRLMDLEMQMGRKADQAAVDTLKLQLALQGGARDPPIIQRDFTYSSSAEDGVAGDPTGKQPQDQQQQQAGANSAGSKASVNGDGGEGGNGDGSDGAGGSGGPAGGQGPQAAVQRQGGMDGLLSMLEGLMADKATKAEVAALTAALGQSPDYKLDVRNAVMEAKRAADAVAVARADTAAQADEIANLQRLLSGMASREEVSGLAQQVGDMLNDLVDLRSQVTQLPRDNEPFKMVLAQADEQQPNQGSQQQAKPASSNSSVAQVGSGLPLRGGGADADSVLKMINALAKELEAMKGHMDILAHATNIMAVGREVIIAQPNPQQANGANSLSPRSQAEQQSSNSPGASGGGATGGGVGFVDGPKDHAGIKAGNEGGGTKSVGGATGATKAGVADLVNGREPGNHRGALSRLIKALGRQSIQQKMDWFEPEVLNRIAQRMGTVDALLKSPLLQGAKGMAGGTGTPDGGRDVEGQMRRLTREIRLLKENQAAPPQFTGGFKDNTSGDYAMLAGKPILGYRWGAP
uniref:Uncharacterized protein n=1 Tax=Dunaliella tertiolecta TaxID=3047 RepID=A0A7S3VMV5_DUNTE